MVCFPVYIIEIQSLNLRARRSAIYQRLISGSHGYPSNPRVRRYTNDDILLIEIVGLYLEKELEGLSRSLVKEFNSHSVGGVCATGCAIANIIRVGLSSQFT